jgi:NAD(P)-dependent dehydrogenase (short-subunit alcohol dehydrogenase family)
MNADAVPNVSIEVVVIIGAGAIGQAIARRIGVAKIVLLADINEDATKRAATLLSGVGYQTRTVQVDVSSHESVKVLATTAAELGRVVHVVHTAGLSPAQASPEAIIAVDLVGAAYVLEEFGRVIAPGGSGIVIASQAGYMIPPLPPEQNEALARTPADQLAQLLFLQPDVITNSGAAYALSKRANTLRVQAASVEWADRGTRGAARCREGWQGALHRRLRYVCVAVPARAARRREARLDALRVDAEPPEPDLPRGGARDAAGLPCRRDRGDPL